MVRSPNLPTFSIIIQHAFTLENLPELFSRNTSLGTLRASSSSSSSSRVPFAASCRRLLLLLLGLSGLASVAPPASVPQRGDCGGHAGETSPKDAPLPQDCGVSDRRPAPQMTSFAAPGRLPPIAALAASRADAAQTAHRKAEGAHWSGTFDASIQRMRAVLRLPASAAAPGSPVSGFHRLCCLLLLLRAPVGPRPIFLPSRVGHEESSLGRCSPR